VDHSRRKLLYGAAMVGGFYSLHRTGLFGLANANEVNPGFADSAAICQGMTNATSAQFVVVLDVKRSFSVRFVTSNGQNLTSTQVRREIRSYSPFAIEKYFVEGLALGQSYRLQVIDNNTGLVYDERNFKALAIDQPNKKFALVSCANDLYKNQLISMWNLLATQKPEAVFFIGDTIYADNQRDGNGDHSGGEENFWNRYTDAFTRIGFYRIKDLIPTIATWDDHDFGANDGDSSFREKHITTNLFQLYWGNEEVDGYENGPGISKVLRFGGQNIFFSDNRSFRNTEYWGSAQSDFIFNKMRQEPRPTWFMDGSQFFGGYRKQPTLENKWPQSLQAMVQELKRLEAPAIFASGDIHFSEISKIDPALLGYQTFEFTSSSIHSYTAPGQHLIFRNPRRLLANSDHNFLMFETQSTQTNIVSGTCKCISNKGLSFTNNFTVNRS
jgi:alkaline phosphatase D